MSDDLVAFLKARLGEDAARAGAATPGPWEWTPEDDVWGQCGPTLIRAGFDGEAGRDLKEVLAGWGHDAWGLNVSEADAAHIAHHDPARVLAEVDAKRGIVGLMARMLNAAEGDSEVDHYGGLSAAEDTLRLIALPYAGHPDYQDDWRP